MHFLLAVPSSSFRYESLKNGCRCQHLHDAPVVEALVYFLYAHVLFSGSMVFLLVFCVRIQTLINIHNGKYILWISWEQCADSSFPDHLRFSWHRILQCALEIAHLFNLTKLILGRQCFWKQSLQLKIAGGTCRNNVRFGIFLVRKVQLNCSF